jgi:ubiquinone/menaquinone biosynthesis C-methylase UbiE
MSVLVEAAHGFVSNPWVYDRVQDLLGYRRVKAWMAPLLRPTTGLAVLEVGAGTGNSARLLPKSAQYIWTDMDRDKLRGYRAKYPMGRGAMCDATQLCLRDKSVDYTLCIAVAHHLTDEQFQSLLREMARVTRQRIIFWDPIRKDGSRISRWLWSYDRGSYPRLPEFLTTSIANWFEIEHSKTYTIYHSYLLCAARPRPAAARAGLRGYVS